MDIFLKLLLNFTKENNKLSHCNAEIADEDSVLINVDVHETFVEFLPSGKRN